MWNFTTPVKYRPTPTSPVHKFYPDWVLTVGHGGEGPRVVAAELKAGSARFHRMIDIVDHMFFAGVPLRVTFTAKEAGTDWLLNESTQAMFHDITAGSIFTTADFQDAAQSVWESVATTYWTASRQGYDGLPSNNASVYSCGRRSGYHPQDLALTG